MTCAMGHGNRTSIGGGGARAKVRESKDSISAHEACMRNELIGCEAGDLDKLSSRHVQHRKEISDRWIDPLIFVIVRHHT